MNLDELRSAVDGDVLVTGDEEYVRASTVYTGVGEPAVAVRPRDEAGVAAAIRYASENGLVLSVRSGGHSASGFGTNRGGVVIDMTAIADVEIVDAEQGLVRIGSGATWGEVADTLREPGLAITSGDTLSVGVGGLTQGGGLGWMVRKYGLAIDHLVGATVVTADGRVLQTSKDENEDLFWAVRGGGGNTGVVTRFEFAAKKVPTVFAGTIQFKRDDLQELLRGWRDVALNAPDELSTAFIALPSFGPQIPPGAMVFACWANDDREAAMAALEPLLAIGEVIQHDLDVKPYADILEEAHPPPGIRIIAKNVFVPEVSDELIATLDAQYGETGAGVMFLRSLGGEMGRVPADATAFAHRDAQSLVVTGTFVPMDATDDEVDALVEKSWGPVAVFGTGAYPGFLTTATERDVKDVFPAATYSKLAEIKKEYDPANLFNQNHNVKPA
jgi:FAD/FMN-containing dehydrogenase